LVVIGTSARAAELQGNGNLQSNNPSNKEVASDLEQKIMYRALPAVILRLLIPEFPVLLYRCPRFAGLTRT
jgi:hypothetical protein